MSDSDKIFLRGETIVDGTGRPIVPVNLSESARLQVTPGEVSDRP